ncbi:MAG TPA: tRNA epoxyqueuosine(34) reductase QueG [Pseudomonadales bacterium]|nr:tRNA epoxyqueuosine(34) reductase QueG [Pseudomonadales bacterium]
MRYSAEFLNSLSSNIKHWGLELGFQQIGICDLHIAPHDTWLKDWLGQHFHGEMAYMARNLDKRCDPATLEPRTLRVITARMDYLPPRDDMLKALAQPTTAYISRYALGRDYHKLMRKRLASLAQKITEALPEGEHFFRAFVDSAPVLEKALAEKAGLGWIGKNTLLINKRAGSWFFLGEIYTDLPLPVDVPAQAHCGSCSACIDICPTQAILGPGLLDARRCISYLTIELRTAIPETLRPLIGNRIYGCDDCQIVCPWNQFAQSTDEADFHPRHQLDQAQLLTLFQWSVDDFLQRTEGSPIRRIGYACWLRNIAVALGNAPRDYKIRNALQQRLLDDLRLEAADLAMVKEHINWALKRQHFEPF